jgi:hypothetical protein
VKDGLLVLDDAGLASEAKGWSSGSAVVPWAQIDLVLLRKTEKGLVVDGFVRDGTRTK